METEMEHRNTTCEVVQHAGRINDDDVEMELSSVKRPSSCSAADKLNSTRSCSSATPLATVTMSPLLFGDNTEEEEAIA